jgi:hypothetical protein
MNSRVLRKTYNIELFKMVNDFGHLNKLLRIPSLTLIKKKTGREREIHVKQH